MRRMTIFSHLVQAGGKLILFPLTMNSFSTHTASETKNFRFFYNMSGWEEWGKEKSINFPQLNSYNNQTRKCSAVCQGSEMKLICAQCKCITAFIWRSLACLFWVKFSSGESIRSPFDRTDNLLVSAIFPCLECDSKSSCNWIREELLKSNVLMFQIAIEHVRCKILCS